MLEAMAGLAIPEGPACRSIIRSSGKRFEALGCGTALILHHISEVRKAAVHLIIQCDPAVDALVGAGRDAGPSRLRPGRAEDRGVLITTAGDPHGRLAAAVPCRSASVAPSTWGHFFLSLPHSPPQLPPLMDGYCHVI